MTTTTTTTTSTKVNTWIGVGMPPPAKRRRIEDKMRIIDASSILETREILEGIHRFLDLEEILQSRLVCKLWNEYFKFRIEISQLTASGSDCDLFPLYMREMFEASIGRFESWFLFLICEYTNTEFKLKLKLKSSTIYPQHVSYGVSFDDYWRCSYPQKTRYNLIANDKKQYKLYEKLLTIFMFERHKQYNVTLHNILFSWLRGLRALALYWLDLYDINHLPQDLNAFHRQLSTDYIEPECGSIPLLQSLHLTKYDYLSSFLGLLTMNGDFELFDKLHKKIQAKAQNTGHSLSTLFPKQHFPNHVYQHKHTFGFAYNVYGLCHYPLIDTALSICDIPRSVCSLKVIRFAILPHILVNIQSDLVLHKYQSGNILSVSLMKRMVTIKKFCFYFDLCATIHSSNLNRANSEEFLVYTQLKNPFVSEDEADPRDLDLDAGQLLHNFKFWKRYMVLCHLVYFIEKYEHKLDIEQYIRVLFGQRPPEISQKLWMALVGMMHKIQIMYPRLHDILSMEKQSQSQSHCSLLSGFTVNHSNIDINSNSNNDNNHNENAVHNTNSHDCRKTPSSTEIDSCFMQIETFLKKQYEQYLAAVQLLDCIGAIYTDENRVALSNLERRGPTTLEEFELFKECVLGSQDVRRYYLAKYDLESLYHAINNVSFHDRESNVGEDNGESTGLMLRHGL